MPRILDVFYFDIGVSYWKSGNKKWSDRSESAIGATSPEWDQITCGHHFESQLHTRSSGSSFFESSGREAKLYSASANEPFQMDLLAAVIFSIYGDDR